MKKQLLKNRIKHKAFSMIEIIMTIVAFTVILTISLPKYMRTVETVKCRKALANLRMIHSFAKAYAQKIRDYPPDCANLDDINSILAIALKDDDFLYNSSLNGNSYDIRATRASPSYTLTMSFTRVPASTTGPTCAGSCPMLVN